MPPFTVASLARIMHSRPQTRPMPAMRPCRRHLVAVEAQGGERRHLQERRARVDEAGDALPRQELAPSKVPLARGRRSTLGGRSEPLGQDPDVLIQRLAVHAVCVGPSIDGVWYDSQSCRLLLERGAGSLAKVGGHGHPLPSRLAPQAARPQYPPASPLSIRRLHLPGCDARRYGRLSAPRPGITIQGGV